MKILKTTKIPVLFLVISFLTGGKCLKPVQYPCPENGTKHYNNWTPHWWHSDEYTACSNIEVVQGLPGYTPIAGKNTLVAFTPSPGCNVAAPDKNARLDIFQIKPNGIISTILSGMTGAPAQGGIQRNHNNNYPVETNFFVDGSIINAPGKYLFVVRWKCCSNNPVLSDSLIADFCTPAQVKILFVPLGEDIWDNSIQQEATYAGINHYLSRMPFPSFTYNFPGSSSQYWDIFQGYIPYKENWISLGFLNLLDETTFYEILEALHEIKEDYNKSATVKADYVAGIYPQNSFWVKAEGRAGFYSVVCNIWDYNIVHELGHLLHHSVESVDSNAPEKTCGYLDREDEKKKGCSGDWGFDPYSKEIIDTPKNILSWSSGYNSFFSRLYYEGMCIEHKGGCASPVLNGSTFSIKTLDDKYFLTANDKTGEVKTISTVEVRKNIPLWRAELDSQDPNGKTWYIKLWWAGTKDNPVSGTNTLLICNPQNGGIRTIAPDHYFNNDSFKDWHCLCIFEHIAMGINIFKYGGYPTTGAIGWGEPKSGPNDYKLFFNKEIYSDLDIDQYYTIPFVQWKIAVNQ